MKTVTVLLGVFVVCSSIMPLIREEDWWIRVFDFPRVQLFVLGIVALAAGLYVFGVRAWPGILLNGALVAALVLQAFRIIPYTPLYSHEVLAAPSAHPDSTISVVVANVLMSNRDADQLLAHIERYDPDIVLTLEPDAWWAEQFEVLEDEYPYTVKEPLDNRYGMLMYSRLELLDPEIKHLVREDIPSVHTRVRLRGGAVVWLHGIHPEPPSPTEADSSTERDAELLIVGREVADRDDPTIVMGDLNDVAWSHTTSLFQKISRLLDPRKGRGMFNTYHAKYAVMRWPLDHVFHSDHFLVDRIERLPAFGSDHFPVYARLVLKPAFQNKQEAPEVDGEDTEEAEEKIDKVEQKESL